MIGWVGVNIKLKLSLCSRGVPISQPGRGRNLGLLGRGRAPLEIPTKYNEFANRLNLYNVSVYTRF